MQKTSGDLLVNRRILGMESVQMRLEGDNQPLAVADLGMINPPARLEPKWVGSIKLNGLWTDGNTDRRAVGASIEAERRAEIDRISFDATWDYSQDQNETTKVWTLNQRRQGGGLKYDYFLSKKWYALATARVLGDTLADIQLRFTGGVGIGYTWVEDSSTTFLTELGVSYFNESFRTPGVPTSDYLAARAAYKLTHSFTEKTKLVHGVEAFPSTENITDTYLQAKTEIVTSLTDSMIASVAHVLDWDNTPSPGKVRSDNRIVLSVGWSF